jgi:hypothetical protein
MLRAAVFALTAVALCAAQQSVSAQTVQPSVQPPAGTQPAIAQQHPEWFTEPDRYIPCPAAVVFSSGRHACLGLPEYRYSITVNWRPRHWSRRFP